MPPSSSRAARLAELRALRAAGKTAAATYVVEEDTQLFDEVDDNDYKNIVRKRLDADDFVVDDNGEGYVDDGREDWDDEQSYGSESEVEANSKAQHGKRKRGSDKQKDDRITKGIGKYFANKNGQTAAKPKAVATAEDAAFMANLLGEVDVNIQTRRPELKMKPIKSESRRKTRIISPPPDERKPSRAMKEANGHGNGVTQSNDMSMDDGFSLPPMDDDMIMSDPLPSSPTGKLLERRNQPIIKKEEVSDDDMEVEQAIGGSRDASKSVNMSGVRHVIKPKKPSYPTPDSSSPPRVPVDAVDSTAWTSITNNLNVLSSPATSQSASFGKLNAEQAQEDDQSLRFFWFDYIDIKGSLCLFGKVKDKSSGAFVSCFLKIDNIHRKLYFLPRKHRISNGVAWPEEITMSDVYNEVDGLMTKLRVGAYKIKPCTRKYAFELPDVPKEAEYLEVLYPYDKPPMSIDLTGETFSRVFGTNTALFEQFVLQKNIMGPCWLNIKGANFNAVTNASWCKLECQLSDPDSISLLSDDAAMEAPPLTLMSLALRTTYDAKASKQEILIISARVYENVALGDTSPAEKLPSKPFTVMRPLGSAYPTAFKVEAQKHRGFIGMEPNESALLSKFMAILGNVDPDVIIGHKLDDVDIGVLLNRLKERKTPGWHRIGRLRRSEWPKSYGRVGGSMFVERQLVAGRLLCDLANDLGKSLMSKCQSWSLSEMCDLILHKSRLEIDNEQALNTWAKTREGLMQYLTHCEADTHFIAAIALKVQMLPLSKQLTTLAGNSWARTLSGTRAERNEYILLHEFHRNDYICPDKVYEKKKAKTEDQENEEGADQKKKDKFKGGLVFEPEKGLYDKYILVMDFNSLYPSIIQEFNICFTTVERTSTPEEEERVPDVPEDQELGILPKLISTLVKRRREVKKSMKDKNATPDQLATWDIKQMALKLTANSMYGCLGYTRSRFYARPLAMLTTFKGREILRSTKELAEGMLLRVIYGDTDSVMINTNMADFQGALKVGREFKKAVNERYRLLEIDIDNVFSRLLLHAKKKYAALNVTEVDGTTVEKMEVKGLDMRRREYCQLSKDTSTKLLGYLLSGEDPEQVVMNIHDHLGELATNMREYKIPVPKYTIFTQLGKDPNDYPNANSMPSVQVALKLMKKGKHIKAKDVMSFIITGDSSGSAERAAKNAYPLEDLMKKDSELLPDIDYYLHKQILPPVERLCAPISGTNVTRLAECLGLDTSKYRVSSVANDGGAPDAGIQPLESQIPDAVRFKDAAPLRLRCRACKHVFSYLGMLPVRQDEPPADEKQPGAGTVSHEGIRCPAPACGAVLPTLSLAAQLDAQLKLHVSRYYAGWLRCDDAACGARTRQMSVYGHSCLGPRGLGRDCSGRMRYEYSEKALYNQLLYLSSLFDVDKAKKALGRIGSGVDAEERQKLEVLGERNRERFGTARDVVKGYLERNGRQWVQMDSLFKFALKQAA